MKNFRILLAVCFLAMATAVNAQFANSSSAVSVGSSAADTEAWQGVRFSYNSYTIDESEMEYDAISAFELGYVKAFSISQELPLFLETGASFVYATGDLFSEYGVDLSLNMSSLVVPFNVGYKVAFGDNMSFFPYVGVSLKGHLAGEMELSYDGNSMTADIFDEDDMGKDAAYNRFQIGWQIGATLNINKFNFGVSYGTDFMELAKKVDSKTFKASVGFNF